MKPTPFRLIPGRSVTCAVALSFVSIAIAQSENDKMNAGLQAAGSALAQGASLLGGALPGGAVISAAVSLTPAGGGEPVTTTVDEKGEFWFEGLKPGTYEMRFAVAPGPRQSTAKQTQGATFSEKVNQGLAAPSASKTKHDTAKNSVGNIRAVAAESGGGTAPEPAAAVSSVSNLAGAGGGAAAASYARVNNINGGMPNRISMNVTIAKRTMTVEADGDPVTVEVGADGKFGGTARVSTQKVQGAPPGTSDKGRPKSEAPPPRPAGG